MKRYSWTDKLSRSKMVQADVVTFEPKHVAFWDEDGDLILAVHADDVFNLCPLEV